MPSSLKDKTLEMLARIEAARAAKIERDRKETQLAKDQAEEAKQLRDRLSNAMQTSVLPCLTRVVASLVEHTGQKVAVLGSENDGFVVTFNLYQGLGYKVTARQGPVGVLITGGIYHTRGEKIHPTYAKVASYNEEADLEVVEVRLEDIVLEAYESFVLSVDRLHPLNIDSAST